jgi:hypothetical protein
MNNIIPLPQIISQLSQLTDCDVATSRKFLHDFFAAIESALMAGESVQIKGVGTFSRSEDATEPVVFVPDEELADAINTPFAMFEAIPLDDEFDDVALNEAMAEIEHAPKLSSDELPVDETNEVPVVDKDEPQIENISKSEEESVSEASVADPETTEIVQSEDVSTNDVHCENQNSEDLESEESELSEIEPITVEENIIEDGVNRSKNNGTVKTIVAFVLGLACGFLAHYLFDIGSVKHDEMESLTDTIPQIGQTLELDTMAQLEDTIAKVEKDTLMQISVAEKEKTEPIYDTVTDKRFLTTMAKQYYGRRDFWVYIYQANLDVIDDPNRIKAGTRVRIPRKEEFSTGATEKDNIDNAHRIAAEIYAKFQ